MNRTRLIFILFTIAVGLGLTIGGAYYTIVNLIQPSGLLYEGVMALGLGLLILLVTLVATSIGKTIILFTDIIDKQAELQEELNKKRSPSPLSQIMQNLQDRGRSSSITVTNLDKPEEGSKTIQITPGSNPIEEFSKLMMNAMKKGTAKELTDMTMEELEAELAKAVKKEKFEYAELIKEEINNRQTPDNQEDTDTTEK